MSLFKRRRFPVEIILLCVRWYCKYGISYRDLAEMMQERGVAVDPSTIFRWVRRVNCPQKRRSKIPHFCRLRPQGLGTIFRRPSPRAGDGHRIGWRDERLGADMLGHQLGVLAQPIARALDLHHHSMVKQAIEKGRGHNGIAENLAPFRKAAIGGQDHGAPLIAGIDQLEEQVAAAGHDRQVADLVHDQQRRPAEERIRSCRRPSRSARASMPIRSASVQK